MLQVNVKDDHKSNDFWVPLQVYMIKVFPYYLVSCIIFQ